MMQERFVRSFDGTELYVSETGEGLPLVLCDGIGCDGFIWRALLPRLAERHRIVRWHYRGHGLSKPPVDPDALAIATLRDDLRAVMDALEIESAVLVGHSLASQMILDFALTYPERVLGLAPLCGTYGNLVDTFHDSALISSIFPVARDAMLRWPDVAQRVWSRFLRSEVVFKLSNHLEVNKELLPSADLRSYFRHLSSMDASIFVRLLDDAANHTVEHRLSEITAPTLVVGAQRDTFVPAWLSERMKELIPGAELLIVPGTTHVAPLELPELVHLRLERFLEDRVLSNYAGRTPRLSARAGSPRKRGGTQKRRKKGA